MRVRGRRWILVGALLTIMCGVAAVQTAHAWRFIDGPGDKPDDWTHSYCWDSTFKTPWLSTPQAGMVQSSAIYGMENLDGQVGGSGQGTAYWDLYQGTCQSNTNIKFKTVNDLPDNKWGRWSCDSGQLNADDECKRATITYSLSDVTHWSATDADRQTLGCHEVGHSVGFVHLIPGSASCMADPFSSTFPNYHAHEVDHALQSHDAPIGHLDNLQAVNGNGNFYVNGWTLDPDLHSYNVGELRPAVQVWVDGYYYSTVTPDYYRSDIGDEYPFWGPYHGFHAFVGSGPGCHSVTVYSLDAKYNPGSTVNLGTLYGVNCI